MSALWVWAGLVAYVLAVAVTWGVIVEGTQMTRKDDDDIVLFWMCALWPLSWSVYLGMKLARRTRRKEPQ